MCERVGLIGPPSHAFNVFSGDRADVPEAQTHHVRRRIPSRIYQ